MPDQFPKKVTKNTAIPFSVNQSALYSISITAHCQGKQDLRVEIDTLKLREIPAKDKPQYNNIPSSWNGTQLKGLAKTIIFILRLNQGTHKLTFISNEEAIINEYKIEPISDSQNVFFNLKMQAEDGDRRPWVTFVLVDLNLNKISLELKLKRRFMDSDDVKIIVDGNIKRNERSLLHKFWYFIASLFTGEIQTETFIENLPSDIHYVELWADRMPVINRVMLDLGTIELKQVPTVDEPKWTGDFSDDTEEIILARAIYGEAGGESIEAKIGVGWSIRNRVKDSQHRWGSTYHEVILQPFQYEPFSDPNSKIFKRITNPPQDDKGELKGWRDSFEVAGEVIKEKVSDPTKGANHFYVPSQNQPTPSWADDKKFTVQIGVTRFYKL